MAFSLLFIVIAPLLILAQKNKQKFLSNLFLVMLGLKTWVGYGTRSSKELPTIKESVLTPASKLKGVNLNEEQRKKLNLIYSKDYKIENGSNSTKSITIRVKAVKIKGIIDETLNVIEDYYL
jgi:hypothetical protein